MEEKMTEKATENAFYKILKIVLVVGGGVLVITGVILLGSSGKEDI